MPRPPVLSINRGFSAPVVIERVIASDELVFLAAHDDDPFARYEALQELIVRHLQDAVEDRLDAAARDSGQQAIAGAIKAVLADEALDDLMRGELLVLPGEGYLAETMLVADPGRIHTERQALRAQWARRWRRSSPRSTPALLPCPTASTPRRAGRAR